MFGFPASAVYAYSNAFYIGAAAVAAICTLLIYNSAAIVQKDEKAEFEAYKIQAGKDVAAAYAEGVQAGREAADAKAMAAEAAARAAESNARAQEAIAQAEASRLEIARLTSPRHLTDEQKAALSSYIKDAPRSDISINFQGFSEGEIIQYAESIADFLMSQGYTIPKEGGVNHMMSYVETGLKFSSHDDEASQKLATSLYSAFKKAGIEARLTSDAALPPERVFIYIGTRF